MLGRLLTQTWSFQAGLGIQRLAWVGNPGLMQAFA